MTVGFDVYGHFSFPCGLKVAADNTVRMLREQGAPVRLHDVSVSGVGCTSERGDDADYLVNIFHINPIDFTRIMSCPDRLNLRFMKRMNVCVPFWELPRVPESWLPVLRGMDLVLAPTTFVADAIRASDPSITVQLYPQTVMVPEEIVAQRERFGFASGDTIFGTSFAAQAVIERKNPWAVIEAFRLAFPPEDAHVRLIVRAYDAGQGDASPILRRLQEYAEADPRIVVLGERLPYEDVMALYASYDVFVSLHRSEGLGLGLMESMMVGTPVIATNWSGTLDFTDSSNSCLVDYRLVPVDVDPSNPYGANSMTTAEQWAEPDIEDAARLMRLLHTDPERRQALGAKARQDMRARHERILATPLAHDLEQAAAILAAPSSGHAARARTLSNMRRKAFMRHRARAAAVRFKRGVVDILRALRLKPPAPPGEGRV